MLSNEELLSWKCFSLDDREKVVFEKKIQFFEANEWCFSEAVWKSFFLPKRESLILQKEIIDDVVGFQFFDLKKEACDLSLDLKKLAHYDINELSVDVVNLLFLEFIFALSYNFLNQETICDNGEVLVELADKFGAWKVRYFIEDRVFFIRESRQYRRIEEILRRKERFTRHLLTEINVVLSENLDLIGIEDFEISFRQKNLYGVYKKLQKKEPKNRIITDLFGFRIIVEKQRHCYEVLKILHQLWEPMPLRLKDYIKNPKSNGYQSLHTTCTCLLGEVVEFQIRTRFMDYIAKYGPASHALYKQMERAS